MSLPIGVTETMRGENLPDDTPHCSPNLPPEPLTKVDDSELAEGDKVEILQSSPFYGKQVFVIFHPRRGQVKVRGKDWAIDRFYQRSELRLIQRSGGES